MSEQKDVLIDEVKGPISDEDKPVAVVVVPEENKNELGKDRS
jgi:hypothetical protein